MLYTDRLRSGDLNVINMFSIPHRLEETIGKAERHNVLDRFLSEKVIDPVNLILYKLKTQQYFERSASLALTVEEEFENIGRAIRGALQRQVGIWVLQAVAMPSILVETGYITNPEEEDYLNSEKGQQETADAITKAVQRYRYSLENPSN